jgi:hypothetical protein
MAEASLSVQVEGACRPSRTSIRRRQTPALFDPVIVGASNLTGMAAVVCSPSHSAEGSALNDVVSKIDASAVLTAKRMKRSGRGGGEEGRA